MAGDNKENYCMKKHFLFLTIILLALSFPVFAQTADEIETLLSAKALSYEQAVSFVLRAADMPVYGPAFGYAVERKWLSTKTAADSIASLNEVSLLIMQAFDIHGGIMYSLTKNPHYAYRELLHQNIIQGRADPCLTVSGELLLFMVGKVLDRMEGEE
jgi:hypothetical protein